MQVSMGRFLVHAFVHKRFLRCRAGGWGSSWIVSISRHPRGWDACPLTVGKPTAYCWRVIFACDAIFIPCKHPGLASLVSRAVGLRSAQASDRHHLHLRLPQCFCFHPSICLSQPPSRLSLIASGLACCMACAIPPPHREHTTHWQATHSPTSSASHSPPPATPGCRTAPSGVVAGGGGAPPPARQMARAGGPEAGAINTGGAVPGRRLS